MKYFLPVIVAFFVIGLSDKSFGQQKDSLKRTPSNTYYQQQLGVDQAKGAQIIKIYDTYKIGVSQIMGDKTQSDDQKRKKIDLLITQKNTALKAILTLQQQQKIIPSSEH